MTSSKLELQRLIDNASYRSKINLSNLQLIDEDMKIIADEAIITKQCTQLDLGSNNITADGALIIANALRSSTTIQRIYLSDNRIADEGVHHLSLSIKNSSLLVLGLSKNRITDNGIHHLSQMLETNHQLIVLGLEENQISVQGLAALAIALKSNHTLQRLLLAENKRINDISFDYIVDIIRNNQSLQRFDIRCCNLSSETKLKLELAAQTKRNFELLD
ncbi:hypothetical protein I4U23_012198 [Adineta vaga]|nr:hypothetical protein I4U23_012198 [Adineta vaga]